MSWLFSRALVEASSGANSSGGEPSAELNVMHTPHPFWLRDKTMEAWSHSQFGLTFAPLTESRGKELLMWFLGDFRAKILPSEGKEQESTELEAVSGNKPLESFAKLDPSLSFWKIRQLLLFEDLEPSLEIWPKWGIMHAGECWELETPAGCTNEIESGLLHIPTPGKNESNSTSRKRFIGSPDFRGAKTSEGLRTCATDPTYTHPRFCETIMGFPSRWTELPPSETPNIQAWLNSHGKR